jgi:hypothetical protein
MGTSHPTEEPLPRLEPAIIPAVALEAQMQIRMRDHDHRTWVRAADMIGQRLAAFVRIDRPARVRRRPRPRLDPAWGPQADPTPRALSRGEFS